MFVIVENNKLFCVCKICDFSIDCIIYNEHNVYVMLTVDVTERHACGQGHALFCHVCTFLSSSNMNLYQLAQLSIVP